MNIKWWHIAVFVAVILAVAAVLHPTELRMGWMYLHSGKTYEAVEKLREAYEEDKSDYRALRNYARALEEAGLMEEAREAFERLIEIKPREDHFQEVVRFYSWMEDPEKRKETFREWYEHRLVMEEGFDDEVGIRILNNLYAHYLMGQEYEKAVKILQELRMVNIENRTKINNDLITVYEKTGDVEGTMRHLEAVLRENPDNAYALEKFVELAMLTDRKGDAEELLMQDVKRNPDDQRAWDRLIDFETRLRDYDTANSWWEKRLARTPEDDELRRKYIDWLLGTEQQQLAMGYIEGLPEDVRDKPYYSDMLLKLYEWNGRSNKLLPIYRANFRANPRDRQNAQKLIWILYDREDYEELEAVLTKLTRLYPRNEEYALQLADIQDMKKEQAAAIRTLERAAVKTDDAEVLKRLGEELLWDEGEPMPRTSAREQRPDDTMKRLSK